MRELIHRDVEVDGIRIHLVEQGEGPLVLLVHGFPESWYSWRQQLPALAAAGYRAVAIDVRGYGRSSRPESIEEYRMTRLGRGHRRSGGSPGGRPRGAPRPRLGGADRVELGADEARSLRGPGADQRALPPAELDQALAILPGHGGRGRARTCDLSVRKPRLCLRKY